MSNETAGKPKRNLQNTQISISMKKSELALIDDMATREGISSRSEFVRRLCIGELWVNIPHTNAENVILSGEIGDIMTLINLISELGKKEILQNVSSLTHHPAENGGKNIQFTFRGRCNSLEKLNLVQTKLKECHGHISSIHWTSGN